MTMFDFLILGQGISIAIEETGENATNVKNIEFGVSLNQTEEEIKILEEAIKDHSNGNHITSLIGAALVLADKLDVIYHRTIHSSIQDEMNLEVRKIKKVDVVITEKELTVLYETTEPLNFSILRGWEKTFTIPEKIASYFGKEYVLKVNGKQMDWRS